MDWGNVSSSDSAERRRLQNRAAQRKFRQKRSLERATEKTQTGQTPTGCSFAPPPPTLAHHPSFPSPSPWLGAGSGQQLTTANPFAPTSNHHQQPIASEFGCSDTLLDTNVSVPDDAGLWNLDIGESFTANLGTSSSDNSTPLSRHFSDAELVSPSTAQSSSVSMPRSISLPQSDVARSHLSGNEEALRPHNQYLQGPERSVDTTPHNGHEISSSGSRSVAAAAASKNGWLSTMHIAAQKGRDHIVRILLRRGMSFDERDSDGRTPLVLAVMESHVAVIRALLAYGARVDDVDHEGRSALHWAVLQRDEAVLSLLLDHSNSGRTLNIDAYDNVGWTPLHLAVERGFEVGMLLLLQHGANLHFKARRCPASGNIIPPDHEY